MSDHFALHVDRLMASGVLPPVTGVDQKLVAECRICQEEDEIKSLESPCNCSGSLKYAHRECVQRWCNEKGNINCEICHQSYKPGYTASPRPNPDEMTIEISSGWTVAGSPLNLRDPRIFGMAASQHRLLEDEYDEYAVANTSAAAFCRSIFLILMALLLLRHTLTLTNGDEEDDASTVFSLILLRAAGFLLPCYIMAWAISIMHRQRQRNDEYMAMTLQSRRHRRSTRSSARPEPATAPRAEAIQ